MAVDVIYPKVSLESDSGKVSRWLVAEGEAVRAGQVLFEIENDKAAVEVESPADGVIHGLADTEIDVSVGARVAQILAAGNSPSEAPVTRKDATKAAGSTTAAPDSHRSAARTAGARSTPLARRIAREQGVELNGLTGSGPGGRIQKKDVLARIADIAAASAALARRQGSETAAGATGALHRRWLRRGSGLPVVALHGFASDLNSWRGLLGGMRWDGAMLGVDLPAHGRSLAALPADLDAIAAAVEDVLAEEIQGPVVLAGHSFGGAVAARIASRGVADVRALCLFAPAGLGPEINGAFLKGILRATNAASLGPWLREMVHEPAAISEDFVRAVVEQRRDAGLTAAMEAFAGHFFPDGTQGVSIRPDLDRIAAPVRVVFGRDDRILPFSATRGLPGHVALHGIDACGHMPQIEHRDLALRLLDETIRSA